MKRRGAIPGFIMVEIAVVCEYIDAVYEVCVTESL